MKAFILDADHQDNRVRLFLRGEKECIIAEASIEPYFYLVREHGLTHSQVEKCAGVTRVEEVEKEELGRKRKYFRVFVKEPALVPQVSEAFENVADHRENDVSFVYRYLIDNNLYAGRMYDFDVVAGRVKAAKPLENATPDLRMLSFDIETYAPRGRMPDAKKDPAIIIGMKNGKTHVMSWKEDKLRNEKEMLQEFVKSVKHYDPDVIVGYNSSNFDIPYLLKRAQANKVKLLLGRDATEPLLRKGMRSGADINGRVHLDAYDGVEFLTIIGALRLPKNDLDSIYFELRGKHKVPIDKSRIGEMWDAGGKQLDLLRRYNEEDTIAAYEIGREILPLYLELSKIIGLPLYSVSRMSASQMVEWMMVREAFLRGEVTPKRPDRHAVSARMANPIKGAFVKLPEEGLHERIAVCDFRSMYPSIIISHNLGPDTLDCSCCSKPFVAPEVGHKFCTNRKALMPHVLEKLIDERLAVKKEMKNHKPGSEAYRSLHFRQWALKIIANASYGYLGFARARWYSREAAESTTALGRKYIHETMDKAEKAGFKVLYGDTDALFLKLENKSVEDSKKFVDKINSELPGRMELEFQGYYPRGLFVTKREGGAAKKKYALIREDGTIEIKGFEFVRRDWANVAKEAQEQVITAVLREGDTKKAVDAAKKFIELVRKRKLGVEDVKIYTQLVRKPSAYEQQAPHVKAAKRLLEAGYDVSAGDVLEYVVIEGEGSISDRSIPVQLLGDKRYDPEYYINNQVLPAVMKILKELGISEEELRGKGKQQDLKNWFE
ncbi:ribonuclease H-like domain-containing protein [Candidatus Micrarchaeota archaeon]|nr:ribonuclease H-like domain-containing protein [Candidatus Micrarchaeota archaeon]